MRPAITTPRRVPLPSRLVRLMPSVWWAMLDTGRQRTYLTTRRIKPREIGQAVIGGPWLTMDEASDWIKETAENETVYPGA